VTDSFTSVNCMEDVMKDLTVQLGLNQSQCCPKYSIIKHGIKYYNIVQYIDITMYSVYVCECTCVVKGTIVPVLN